MNIQGSKVYVPVHLCHPAVFLAALTSLLSGISTFLGGHLMQHLDLHAYQPKFQKIQIYYFFFIFSYMAVNNSV